MQKSLNFQEPKAANKKVSDSPRRPRPSQADPWRHARAVLWTVLDSSNDIDDLINAAENKGIVPAWRTGFDILITPARIPIKEKTFTVRIKNISYPIYFQEEGGQMRAYFVNNNSGVLSRGNPVKKIRPFVISEEAVSQALLFYTVHVQHVTRPHFSSSDLD